ncbi:hypothetical protein ACFQX6_38005 [Streptosporangium lutulentum]
MAFRPKSSAPKYARVSPAPIQVTTTARETSGSADVSLSATRRPSRPRDKRMKPIMPNRCAATQAGDAIASAPCIDVSSA